MATKLMKVLSKFQEINTLITIQLSALFLSLGKKHKLWNYAQHAIYFDHSGLIIAVTVVSVWKEWTIIVPGLDVALEKEIISTSISSSYLWQYLL